MGLEQKINYQLNKYPFIKKGIKRVYQLSMYAISKKIKSEGDIVKLSPEDKEQEYFFGYYDKSPWDASGRYVICMRAKDTWSEPDPNCEADILLIDVSAGSSQSSGASGNNVSEGFKLVGGKKVKKIATTHTWNVQQGCMAQWLGPDFSSKILYNDLRDGKYCSVVLDVATGKESVLSMACYTVSADGRIALGLDFSRLHSLRLGYGYSALPETTKDIALPDATAVWKMDVETGEVEELLTYKDFATFEPRQEMKGEGTVHKVNHLMISPNGKRFMVLYRWFVGSRKYTRLVTCNIDGTEMYVLSDDDMVSHCFWKNDEEILAFERKKEGGPGYYLMKDKSQEWKHIWPQFSNDGHPSYCPNDASLVVFDTYPNKARVQQVKVARDNENEVKVMAQVFAPFRYDNDTRCDLHPRWSRDGKKVCFDSVYEGCRGLYMIEIK